MKLVAIKNVVLTCILLGCAFWLLNPSIKTYLIDAVRNFNQSKQLVIEPDLVEDYPEFVSPYPETDLDSTPPLDLSIIHEDGDIEIAKLPNIDDSGLAIESLFANTDEVGSIEAASLQMSILQDQDDGDQFKPLPQPLWGEEPDPNEIVADDIEDLNSFTGELEPPSIEFTQLPAFAPGGDDNQFIPKVPTDLKNLKQRASAANAAATVEDSNWWVQAVHQPQLTQRRPVPTTLDEVIFSTLQNAPQIQIINSQPKIQQTIVKEADADFDWTQFITTSYDDRNDPLGSTLTVSGGTAGQRFLQREWAFESGVRKQNRNGSTFSLGQQYGTLDNNSNFLIPEDQGTSALVLDYRQPLLQGRGANVATSQVALADLNLDSISSQALVDIQGYMLEVVEAYWDLYLQRAVLVQNRRSAERAAELFRQLTLRDGIDVRNDQLLRAEAALAARRSQVIRAEFDLINAQDRLINLAFGANSTHADEVELMPEPIGFPIGIEFAPADVVQAAIHNRPEVHRAIAQIKTGAVRLNLARNQLLPRLDAIISSQVSGLRGETNIAGAFSDQFAVGAPSYTVGLEYEFPFGNRAARSRLERSQLEAEVFEKEFQREVGDIVLDARVSSRRITRLNQENQNNWHALMKAAEELSLIQERQRLSLDDGKTGSLYIEDLLASQGRLTAAEARLAQSQTEQAVAIVNLKRATGELFRDYHQSVLPVRYTPILPRTNYGRQDVIYPAPQPMPQHFVNDPNIQGQVVGEPTFFVEETPIPLASDNPVLEQPENFTGQNQAVVPESNSEVIQTGFNLDNKPVIQHAYENPADYVAEQFDSAGMEPTGESEFERQGELSQIKRYSLDPILIRRNAGVETKYVETPKPIRASQPNTNNVSQANLVESTKPSLSRRSLPAEPIKQPIQSSNNNPAPSKGPIAAPTKNPSPANQPEAVAATYGLVPSNVARPIDKNQQSVESNSIIWE